MIRAYLNQDATLYRYLGQSGNGSPVYDQGTPIKVRWQGSNKLVRTGNGEEVLAQAEGLLTEEVKVEDKVAYQGQDYIILAVKDSPGLMGEVSHRVVYA